MDILIDLGDSQSELQHPLSSTKKVFGVIKRNCFATDLTNIEDKNGELLKPGTLIQIIPDYHGGSCHFKIRDFTNWLDKYKTSIYKCSIDDYIAVSVELWPFLLAIENGESRVKYVQNVYNREFDIDLLKLGREIRIQRPPDDEAEFFEFIVTYIGVVAENGKGHYIGLRMKNEHELLTSDLRRVAEYYTFGGTGIIVPADWVMLNLYKGEECKLKPTNTQDRVETPMTENEWVNIEPIEFPKKIIKTGAIPKTKQSNFTTKIPNGKICINLTENIYEIGATETRETPNPHSAEIASCNSNAEPLNYTAEIELLDNADGVVKNIERTKCDLCSKTVEIGHGIILRDCIHTYCMQCARAHVECNTKFSSIQCPYDKEYKCLSNLLDIEIKDLGGDEVYNKILENRMKEFVVTDPNARMCSNEACKNIWVSPGKMKNERCPKCQVNWCYECDSAHEPDTRHQYKREKSIVEQLIGLVFGSEPADVLAICAKCRKPDIAVTQRFSLKNCGHTFCNDCIIAMIASQQYDPKCTICRKRLNNDEVTQITRMEELKLYSDKGNTTEYIFCGNTQPESEIAAEMCLCKPPDSSRCSFVLKCKHEFCRALLIGIVRKQLKYMSRAACPVCHHEIANYQLKRLIDQKKSTIVQKCRICHNQAAVQLTLCKDWFCEKCIYDLMKKQAIDLQKIFVVCTVCNTPVIQPDIERYGNPELLAHLKLNMKGLQKRLNDTTLNNKSLCTSCEQTTPTEHGIILARCRHFFCILCCRNFITMQISNRQMPSCPFCKQELQKIEVDRIMQSRFGKSNTSLVKCLKCMGNFEGHLIHKCSECLKSICIKCADVTLGSKLADYGKPNCPFCATSLDKEQNSFSAQQVQDLKVIKKSVVMVDNNCSVCLEPFDMNRIKLTDCSHYFCQQCIQIWINRQLVDGKIPTCPKCRIPITSDQKGVDLTPISYTDSLPRDFVI